MAASTLKLETPTSASKLFAKLALLTLAGMSFFATAAHAFSVTREEYVQFDQNSVMAYLTVVGRAEARVEFRGFEPSDDTNFIAYVSPTCQWALRVMHTPIPRGIGNGMVERKVQRLNQVGRCFGDEATGEQTNDAMNTLNSPNEESMTESVSDLTH